MKNMKNSRNDVIKGLESVRNCFASLCMSVWDAHKMLDMVDNAISYLKSEVPHENCVNCIHYDVCKTVAVRKSKAANDYSPCEHWRSKE